MMFVVNARVQVVVAQEKVEKRVDDSLGSTMQGFEISTGYEVYRKI